jgi:hypothetical protein
MSVLFSSSEGDDVRDLVVEYVNSNAIDLLIIGRRSLESACYSLPSGHSTTQVV